MKKLFILLTLFLALSQLTHAQSLNNIEVRKDASESKAILFAGIIQRVIHISDKEVYTSGLKIDGESLMDSTQREISFRISIAEPKQDTGTEDQVKWIKKRYFTGRTWGKVFNHLNIQVYDKSPGVKSLIIRARCLDDEYLAGLSVNLIYEIYEGYPVIRKWVEFHNNSSSWIKIDSLTIDDIHLKPDYFNQTALTPGERGAGPSIIAFSNKKQSKGVIIASEIPSALRDINDQGAAGYTPEYFEWVLEPADHFVSEPAFIYGFCGPVEETPSARSIPLDRAVESGFRNFQHEHLGISPAHIDIPAPQWATWSNFGPEVNDSIVREQAEIAARCGFVLFELDDGWQRGRLGIEPHPDKFPDMEETARYILSQGLRLGLWVSSFRMPDEKDFKALPTAPVNPEIKRLDGLAMSFSGPWSEYYARDLVFLHDYYGATYFKQDFTNIKYGDLGAGTDARTRKESLLRGLRGLLESQDILRRQAPDVSNQITHEIYWGTPGVPADLAALKHASLYHIPPNDYSGVGHWKKRVGVGEEWNSYNPKELTAQLLEGCFNARKRFWAHRGLPLECIEYYGAATVNWKGSLTKEVQDRQICSWLMGAPLLYAGDLASLTEENIRHYHKRFDEVKRLQKEYNIYRYFQYSGVPEPTDEDWHWWGKLNEESEGAVVVIRGRAGPDKEAINIPWVDRTREYVVKALFSGDQMGSFTGAELQDGEMIMRLPHLGQEILEIRAKKDLNNEK